ncbi:UNVERIFIED_CONTAM: hypothetical protein GTU68_052826 [Idotea baltica]|nr:hypothetical protein [Idotea baltica]
MNDVVVFVEHAPVYTVGRSVSFQENKQFPEVPWVEVGRGGKATYHGPGQLVVYPVFDLERHGKDVHKFLRALEKVGIQALEKFGVVACVRAGLTGIWVKTDLAGNDDGWKKIASMGSLAINVSTDLKYFSAIDACGQEGQVVTSLEEVLDVAPSIDEVKQAFLDALIAEFSFELDASEEAQSSPTTPKLQRRARPSWLRVKAPGSPDYMKTQKIVKDLNLVTVCEEAQCPNIGECWSHSTATFMIMGELCTRRCSFCAVKDGTLQELQPLDPMEPVRVAQAINKLGLAHVVITSVNRDDLPDMGALHFNRVVRAIKKLNPDTDVELLIPDMRGKRKLVEQILVGAEVAVLNHNIETVPSLYKMVRPGAKFQRSLDILRWAREITPSVRSKSGLMLGLGETSDEVLSLMDSLRDSDVQVMTIGQYLQPSGKQLPVQRFVTPEEFAFYKVEGLKRGFMHVESGPLVRSSYHAWQHTGDKEVVDSPVRSEQSEISPT